jgi:hypothetical protein
MPARRLIRTVQEKARDIARSLVGTPEFVRSRNERKKVELDFLPESGSPAVCVDHAARRTRRRSRSNLARPYICRLISLSR